MSPSRRVLLARLLILAVLAWNLQAALAFLMDPALYAPAFELTGIPGQAALRGTAVLFLMWNIPYVFALAHPAHNRRSLMEACLMQLTGLLGESAILAGLDASHAVLRSAVLRFIAFDASGLLLLAAALWLASAADLQSAGQQS